MSKSHILNKVLQTADGGKLADTGATVTGDTETNGEWTVNANGGGSNAIAVAFPAAGLKSLGLLSTVPCVVTLTGATVIDGITIGTVTLAANALRQVLAITGDVTAISIGANTTSSGPAGVLKTSLLFNS